MDFITRKMSYYNYRIKDKKNLRKILGDNFALLFTKQKFHT